MKLLQISERASNIKPQVDSYAIGIDLGTTNSVVACVLFEQPKVLGPILPSIYQDIRSIKRLMGSNELVNELSPVEISSKILSQLKQQAEEILGESVGKAVITVPAHFDDAARNDTKLAAQIAGLEVLRLINEPTAAAVSYGLDNEAEGLYLIYDFGGGTFDVSILKMEKGVFQVLATGGDRHLGGDDIDYQIMEYLKLPEESYYIAKSLKERLSLGQQDPLLDISEFEQIVRPFIEKTIQICKDTIENSKIDPKELKEVVLVGGSTRIPLLKQMITENIKKPLDTIDPDTVVALGAAIQGHALLHGSNNLLLDVTPLSIGLEVMGGMNEKVIARNTTIPLSATKYFTTYQDGQTGIIFHIVQGEREMVADCRSLARFELKNIPPMKAALAKVAVTFNIDADGLLSITAIEETSGVRQQVEVKPSYGLTDIEIENIIEQSYLNAAEDIKTKQFAESKLTAQNNIINITEAVNEDSDLLSERNQKKIRSLISNLKNLIDSNNVDLIIDANDKLEKETSSFIQDRLNRQIQKALGGKSVKDIIDNML